MTHRSVTPPENGDGTFLGSNNKIGFPGETGSRCFVHFIKRNVACHLGPIYMYVHRSRGTHFDLH